MNEEKNISGKDIIKVLLGNKWLYLLLAAAFLIVSFISLSVISQSKVEYISFFDYDVAGFSTSTSENGEELTLYIDGEKFDTRTVVSEEKGTATT